AGPRAGDGRRAAWPAQEKSRSRRERPRLSARAPGGALFHFRFLEDDVLPRDRVVFLELELLGLGAWVLLRHIVKAGVCTAHQLDQDGVCLGHSRQSVPSNQRKRTATIAL